MINAEATARDIEQRCKAAGNAERAVGECASLKGDLEPLPEGRTADRLR
jgi:hypothetical protein